MVSVLNPPAFGDEGFCSIKKNSQCASPEIMVAVGKAQQRCYRVGESRRGTVKNEFVKLGRYQPWLPDSCHSLPFGVTISAFPKGMMLWQKSWLSRNATPNSELRWVTHVTSTQLRHGLCSKRRKLRVVFRREPLNFPKMLL